MSRLTTLALAVADAHADVLTYSREYGLLPLMLTLEPDEVTWEQSARGSDMASLNMLPEAEWDAYYAAYGAHAELLIRKYLDPQGRLAQANPGVG